jgi:molecular chaperone DnaJ
MELELDFLEAVFGGDRKLEVGREQLCARCGGAGAEPGTKSKTCDRCGGAGEVRTVQNTIFGRVMSAAPCPRCNGEGRVHEQHCARCRGTGREHATRELTLTVPAGIDDGQQLRLTGEGEAGFRGGPPGDLYVQIHVRPHPVFQRRGHDLIYELRASPALAALGGTVDVPTVDGMQSIEVPAGTQHASLLRLRGKGVPRLGSSSRGDQIVVINVTVPTKLSAKERKLWEELREVSGEPDRAPAEKGLLDHLKDVFRG